MPYATQQDLVDRFGATELVQLTDRTNRPPSAIDATIVSRALADAAGFVDGYLAGVYTLPLSTVPANVTKTVCDIARYHLHGKSAGKDDAVTRAYTDAGKWLADVARGLVKLDDGGAAPEPIAGGGARVSGGDPVFTRHTLRGL